MSRPPQPPGRWGPSPGWPGYPGVPLQPPVPRSGGVCSARNNTSQAWGESASIGYDADTYDARGSLTGVKMSASTSAWTSKGRTTSNANANDLADRVFTTAVTAPWPDDQDLRDQATKGSS